MTEVVIISTIHGAHKTNPNYSYDSLFSFIEKFNPEVIGVEIRAEDIDSPISYLKTGYPYEMYECIDRYPSKKVLGFDWFGAELSGKAIPNNYWREVSAVKKLQNKLTGDSSLLPRLSILSIIKDEMVKLALRASLRELNDGKYDLMSHIYYEQLKTIFQDTEYIALSDFYHQRDEHIAQNILEIIEANKGKRMIFLLGADHRAFTLKKVSQELGNHIILNQAIERK